MANVIVSRRDRPPFQEFKATAPVEEIEEIVRAFGDDDGFVSFKIISIFSLISFCLLHLNCQWIH
jgi:uncharacterized protein YcsI (UPF0317 family)